MDEFVVFGVLLAALVLFVTGKVRYDIVALGALLILTVVQIVPAANAFRGFGHPAVITVGAVLVLSKMLESSGVIDVLERWFTHVGQRLTVQIASLSGLVAVLSAFMNNVGALSLLMPLAVRAANTARRPIFALPDAAVVRVPAGRLDNAGRHAAEHNHRHIPPRSGWRSVRNVRLHAGRRSGRNRRHRIHRSRRLAAHTVSTTAKQPVGRHRPSRCTW